MNRSTERILTTHVGSLPRPPDVVEVVRRAEAGANVGKDEFVRTIEPAVARVIERQVEVGLDIINDGEQSKFSFTSYHKHRLTGFTLEEPVERRGPIAAEAVDFPEYFARWPYLHGNDGLPVAVCTGPIAYQNLAAVEDDIARLKTAAERYGVQEIFMTAISPATLVRITPNKHYATHEAFEEAVADAMRVEYEAIANSGILLQVDCPDFGVTPRQSGTTLSEHRQQVQRNVELLDYATRNIPADRVRFHVCWGADEAPHHRDVPLAEMLTVLLQARPQGMTIVGANGRHEWEWQVWKNVELPDGKLIVPGVIDSTTNIIEHPETVAERIVRYAEVLGRENVVAGVDCGLDTVAGVHQVDPEIAWAKLASLAEGARLASERLWR